MIGLGGSGGTALITPALQRLPVGVPKIVVSTVASGDVAPYVGESDIALMYSVTDVAGLNRISRVVLANAAGALAGALSRPPVETGDKPALGLTMFGVTTPCVTAVTEALHDEYDCLVFHATGTGGRAMEKLVDDGLVSAVCDVSTTEIADLVAGGVMAATDDRLGAIARRRVPWVGSVGALDMVNFGAPDTVPERYRDRLFYEHNPQVTLMRTTPDECRAAAGFLARKLNACDGPVRLLVPLRGVSALDVEGGPFADPAATEALVETLRAELDQTDRRRLVETDLHVNDPQFATRLVAELRADRRVSTHTAERSPMGTDGHAHPDRAEIVARLREKVGAGRADRRRRRGHRVVGPV